MFIDTSFSDDELPEEYGKRLGVFIRTRRNDLNKNQITLAVEVGLDTGAISRLERGMQNPRMAILFRLAKALGVSMCDMMAAAEGVSDADDLRKFLLYKSAPPVYREMVDIALKATEHEKTQHTISISISI